MLGRDQAGGSPVVTRSAVATGMGPRSETGSERDVVIFFALAFGITWCLDLPLMTAWLTGRSPPAYAMPMVGLGALGPTVAAFIVAARRHALGDVFGRWRTSPTWVLLALVMPAAVHLAAAALYALLGGKPAHWLYPPTTPAHVAALVMFPLGEEFGWRGFAYPRLERARGPIVGSLLLGSAWGVWHLGMLFAPDPLRPLPATTVLVYVAELSLWSVVIAWVFERSGRSIAVAIAIHAGAHLDNVSRAPESEVGLRVLRLVVLAAVAATAARALSGRVRSARSVLERHHA